MSAQKSTENATADAQRSPQSRLSNQKQTEWLEAADILRSQFKKFVFIPTAESEFCICWIVLRHRNQQFGWESTTTCALQHFQRRFIIFELFISVQTGLISDSFHMFFDCTGLLAGLAASVITKWKANDKYSYGYVRAEVLAGFVNSLFLLFIAFFILSEGVERAIEPPEVIHLAILKCI